MPIGDKNDAYGHEIYDYFRGKQAVEIVERDDGYVDFSSGPWAYFAEFRKWPSFERRAIKFARGRILDIGCGAGRVLLHLKRRGHDVAGIDNSPLAIKVTKKRGIKKAYIKSITDIGKDLGIFDTIVMFGNNFGLFGSYRRARWILRKMYHMTSPMARIIAESCDVYATNLPEHLEYHRRNRRRGRMSGQLRIRIRYKKYKSPYFDYLLVSPEEMAGILKDTGWEIKRFFADHGPAYAVVIEKTR